MFALEKTTSPYYRSLIMRSGTILFLHYNASFVRVQVIPKLLYSNVTIIWGLFLCPNPDQVSCLLGEAFKCKNVLKTHSSMVCEQEITLFAQNASAALGLQRLSLCLDGGTLLGLDHVIFLHFMAFRRKLCLGGVWRSEVLPGDWFVWGKLDTKG